MKTTRHGWPGPKINGIVLDQFAECSSGEPVHIVRHEFRSDSAAIFRKVGAGLEDAAAWRGALWRHSGHGGVGWGEGIRHAIGAGQGACELGWHAVCMAPSSSSPAHPQRFDAKGPAPSLITLLETRKDLVDCTGKRVFIPGCGRGYDNVLFALQGAKEALGLELAPTAVSLRHSGRPVGMDKGRGKGSRARLHVGVPLIVPWIMFLGRGCGAVPPPRRAPPNPCRWRRPMPTSANSWAATTWRVWCGATFTSGPAPRGLLSWDTTSTWAGPVVGGAAARGFEGGGESHDPTLISRARAQGRALDPVL